MATQKETIAKSPSGRVKRTPVHTRNVLTVKGKDPEYEYRIVNDKDDRVQMFQEAGYEIVPASEIQVGDKRVNAATPEGSLAMMPVGGGQKAYVMRQLKEFYKEDQDAKQGKIRQLEETMKQEASSQGGKFEVDISTKF